MTVSLRGTVLETRFAVPSGRASEVLAALDSAGLGLARARVAERLGRPDPFALRAALAEAPPDTAITGCKGLPLTADAADAALVAAGADPGLAGIFAGRRPGPLVRAVPVDDGGHPWLRWAPEDPPPPRIGPMDGWSTADIGDEAVATVRCCIALPGGVVALGSDYGLTLALPGEQVRFLPFPWPAGARREARRVEAIAVHAGELVVATSQALFRCPLADLAPPGRGAPPRTPRVTSRRHGADDSDGYDDLNALLSVGERLYLGYRTRFEGGSGPRDVLSLASDPHGVVYAGTRSGEVHVVDGGGPIRVFADHKGRPVRHLAFAAGALWVAALGALHRFDGCRWTTLQPEPVALATDDLGRLWALAEGGLWWLDGDALVPVDVPLERPWSLAASRGALWIGGRERVWRLTTG
jgi:hypothetical protein